MLSVVLYGRNDQHGYNYHKRLSMSINAIAEELTDELDEILFTDYNSPDPLPTALEAIQDTLTDRAKELIRIFRVRNAQHAQFSKFSNLSLLEPIARNVAIRRSNPKNKWILSSNADMLFIPTQKLQSLSSILAELSNGFYLLPRFELPEQFWELNFDRMNPKETIDFLRTESERLHLPTVVRMGSFIEYDNPGDFQLFLREDLFKLQGFDERMLKGWHVDANLCKRAALLLKKGTGLEKHLACFHCNHTQALSTLHDKNHLGNNWNEFVNNPRLEACLKQEGWGLANETIEEIRLNHRQKNVHLQALYNTLNSKELIQDELHCGEKSYRCLTYRSEHILPFLTDHLCHISKKSQIAYIGFNSRLKDLIGTYLQSAGFSNPLLEIPSASFEEMARNASVLIFDFGFDSNEEKELGVDTSSGNYKEARKKLKLVLNAFFQILKHRKLISSQTKWIGVQVTQTDFQAIFQRHLAICLNTLITGVSYGILPSGKRGRRKTERSLKKRMIAFIYYCVVRYFFDYADSIRSLVMKSKISKYIKNTV